MRDVLKFKNVKVTLGGLFTRKIMSIKLSSFNVFNQADMYRLKWLYSPMLASWQHHQQQQQQHGEKMSTVHFSEKTRPNAIIVNHEGENSVKNPRSYRQIGSKLYSCLKHTPVDCPKTFDPKTTQH